MKTSGGADETIEPCAHLGLLSEFLPIAAHTLEMARNFEAAERKEKAVEAKHYQAATNPSSTTRTE
jgi:hypothetical protein